MLLLRKRPLYSANSRRHGTRLVRHAKLVRVHAHAAHAGHRKVEGRHCMAQLPCEGQHETAQAGIHVAPYARPPRDLRQRHGLGFFEIPLKSPPNNKKP